MAQQLPKIEQTHDVLARSPTIRRQLLETNICVGAKMGEDKGHEVGREEVLEALRNL
jgi:hypothetical protein